MRFRGSMLRGTLVFQVCPRVERLCPAATAASASASRTRDHPIEIKARIELVRMAFRELTGGSLASSGTARAFSLAVAPARTFRLCCSGPG